MVPSSRNCSDKTNVSGQDTRRKGGSEAATYLWTWDAEVLSPRHNNNTAPTTATRTRNRVLVKKTHTALVGGRLARAAFQLTPPLGRSIFEVSRWPSTTTPDGRDATCARQSRLYDLSPDAMRSVTLDGAILNCRASRREGAQRSTNRTREFSWFVSNGAWFRR